MKRELFAEFLGSVLLAATVIGSGIMAERLAAGNTAVALLGNTFATVAMLAVLIATFGPISGAHFNPVITLMASVHRVIDPLRLAWFVPVQLAGCCAGALLANTMFELPLIDTASRERAGLAQWLGEFVATAGLVIVAFTSASVMEAAWRVPAWIAAAQWFTSSTSFANPAITFARSLSDSFAGIRPEDVPGFVGAQLAGATAGYIGLHALRDPAARA